MPHPTDRDATFDAAVDRAARDLADEARRAVSEHPEVDEIVAYQEGRLGGDRAAELRRHLMACPACARELLQLEDFDIDQPVEPALTPTAEETAKDWAEFQQRTAEDESVASVFEIADHRPSGATPTGSTAPARGRWLVAASILIATTGLAFWITGLLQRAGPPVPIPAASWNPFGFDLLPDGESRVRAAADEKEVAVPPKVNLLVARLKLGNQAPHDSYRAELFDAAGNADWSQSELRGQPTGEFIIVVPRASLPADRYLLRLFGITGSEETLLATYSFDLQYAPGE